MSYLPQHIVGRVQQHRCVERGAKFECDGDVIVVTAGDGAGVDGRADAGHYPAAEQSCRGGVGLRVDRAALAFVHEGLFYEVADSESGGQLGAVGQRHFLGGAVAVEAQLRTATLAGAALPAHGVPVEDDEVAGCDVDHAVADGFDGAGGLVAEEEGVVVVDTAIAVGQIGVAHQAMILTTTSPGLGSGMMMMSTNSTGCFLLPEITPRALSDSMLKSRIEFRGVLFERGWEGLMRHGWPMAPGPAKEVPQQRSVLPPS